MFKISSLEFFPRKLENATNTVIFAFFLSTLICFHLIINRPGLIVIVDMDTRTMDSANTTALVVWKVKQLVKGFGSTVQLYGH